MNYLLDTSIIIEMLRNNPKVKEFITANPKARFTTSTICAAEIWEGIFREREKHEKKKEEFVKLLESFDKVIFFNSEQAQIAGEIRSNLAVRGKSIGDLDVLIAAAAKVNNATIWTKNPKHFQRIKNLEVLAL